MKLEAPLTVEVVALNDWRYCDGLSYWNVDWVMVRAGWPPLLILKLLGLGFRIECRWGDHGS